MFAGRLTALVIIITFSSHIYSQNLLPMPREIKKAYTNNTRSVKGVPGDKYWQNTANYTINAKINPVTGLLTGEEEIRYFNYSPDTLKKLVFKLYQNAYKPGAVRNTEITPETLTDGLLIDSMFIENIKIDFSADAKKVITSGTNMTVLLQQPLPPGKELQVTVHWHFTVPKGTNIRMGTYGENTFFVAYWFPRIAVYDDLTGWDLSEYDLEHEHYSEYGNFLVKLTVPSGFCVWATGMLQNPGEVLHEKILQKYNTALQTDSIINVISKEDLLSGEITKKNDAGNTWIFGAVRVPDFAFGISNRYLWDATSTNIDGRRVAVFTAYDTASTYFPDAVTHAKRSVQFFSSTMPGIPYPYPQITVFNGDDGMEYPMIVNDGNFGNTVTDVYVTAHEIAHTYFPFYVGINEYKASWMEEGWAYFLPLDVQKELSDFHHLPRAVAGYSRFAGSEMDMPLITPSVLMKGGPLQMLNYYKPAIAYAMLQNVLGAEKFLYALKNYIITWNGKHPTPYDFFYCINKNAGEDLQWFWIPWFFESGAVPDLSVKFVTNKNGATIVVEKIGSMPVPVEGVIEFTDGTNAKFSYSASVWKTGNREFSFTDTSGKKIRSVKLGNEMIPDADKTNNIYEIK